VRGIRKASRVALSRRLAGSAFALAVVCTSVLLTGAAAGPATAGDEPEPAPPPLNGLIDPSLLESVQQSIVGLVVIWEEPEDPFALGPIPESGDATSPDDELPVMTICTGWFDTPTTIVTAGHCVDPEEGRLALDSRVGPPIDPGTGVPMASQSVRPEPERTVWAFQPRELTGAVITAPIIVRVDSFRPADEGDTAKLEMYGMPPAKPLPIAPVAPRLGETVTSIGFPGLNIDETDGVDVRGLMTGGKTPAEVLQDSRLQPVNTSGTITAQQFREGVAVYQINADLAEGISGGPTLSSRGEVLGLNSRMTVPFLGQNFNVITDTGMLREFLGHGDGAPGDGTSEPSQVAIENTVGGAGQAAGWTVVVALLGGAIVGALAMWLFSRPRHRPASAGPAREPEHTPVAPD
jgi:Trypsin-like peptidase domain